MNRCPESEGFSKSQHQEITLICNKDLVCHDQLTKSGQGPKLNPDTKVLPRQFQTMLFRTKHSR